MTVYIDQTESNQLIDIFLSQHLNVLQAHSLLGLLRRMETSNGIHFVVKRMKEWRSALRSRDLSCFRKNKSGGLYGPFGFIYSKSLSSRKNLIRMDRCLRVYGRWTSDQPTKADWTKYQSSISVVKTTDLDILPSSRVVKMARECVEKSTFSRYVPLSETQVVPFTRKTRNCFTANDHFWELLKHCPNLVFAHRELFKLLFDSDFFDRPFHYIPNYRGPDGGPDSVVGKISALVKDRGLKIRYIANPLIGIQLGTSRLQQACDLLLQRLPESLVHDQQAIFEWVKPILDKDLPVWSIDLTAATDNFPLEVQTRLLSRLFPTLEEDISLWARVSRSYWKTPHGTVRYRTGQPMGVACSFAAFSLTHTLLIRSLGGNQTNFRVCGDDVIITDRAIALRYCEVMKEIGVEISLSKSLMGMEIAEFAGRTIDKHGPWQSYKASKLNLSADPLGYVRQYGLAALSMYPTSVRPMIAFFSRLPGFLGLSNYEDVIMLDRLNIEDIEHFYPTLEVETFPVLVTIPERDLLRSDMANIEGKRRSLPGSLYGRILVRESAVGLGANNSPILAEHVLINSTEVIPSKRSPFMLFLISCLERGQQAVIPGEDRKVKQNFTRLKRLFKLLKPVEP